MLRSISRAALLLSLCMLVLSSCQAKIYGALCVVPKEENASDRAWSEKLYSALSDRNDGSVSIFDTETEADGNTITVCVHVDPNMEGDYMIEPGQDRTTLLAKDDRTMEWLMYQYIKHCSETLPAIKADDLLPAVADFSDNSPHDFAFSYREAYLPCNIDQEKSAVLGLNNFGEDWGIWGHNIGKIAASAKDDDVWASVNGKRTEDQLCFSSDVLYKTLVKYIVDNLGEGEEKSYRIAIMPNDNTIACLCARCTAAGNKPGVATPAVTKLVEKLAERFPRHRFYTSAYMTTAKMPDHRLPDNVGVLYSAINFPRAAVVSGSEDAHAISESLVGWGRITNEILVWDYINNFDDYFTPFPILSIMQQRLQLYRNMGVSGVFLNGSGYQYSNAQEMHSYVLAALLMDPDQDVEKMIRDYYRQCCPFNAQTLSDFYVGMEKASLTSGVTVPMYGGTSETHGKYYPEDDFLNTFRSLVSDDSEYSPEEKTLVRRERFDMAYTALEYARYNGLTGSGYTFAFGNQKGEYTVKKEVGDVAYLLATPVPTDDIEEVLGYKTDDASALMQLSEAGAMMTDYGEKCSDWLANEKWNDNLLIGVPVTVKESGDSLSTMALTDGVDGIGGSYHWGWTILPQEGTTLSFPSAGITGGRHISLRVMSLRRHRISPPASVKVLIDGKVAGEMKPAGGYALDDGDTMAFSADISFSGSKGPVVLEIVPGGDTRDLAIDEIIVSK